MSKTLLTERKLLTRKEIADYLGVSESKAHQMLHSKGFPTVRIGRRIFANKDMLATWIDEQTAI